HGRSLRRRLSGPMSFQRLALVLEARGGMKFSFCESGRQRQKQGGCIGLLVPAMAWRFYAQAIDTKEVISVLERICEIMESTPAKVVAEVAPLTNAELRARPRPHCWSIVEVVVHIDDAE